MNMPTPCQFCGEICEFMVMMVVRNKFLCDECYEEEMEEQE